MTLTHSDHEIVTQVIAILHKDFKYQHPHAKLADRFHISDRKLRNIFKEATDKTIKGFLTTVRIEKAKELLCMTDDPIKKIASSVGYDTRSLERKFKYFTDMTPLDWRNQKRKEK